MYDQKSESYRNGFPEVPVRTHTETGSYSVTRAVAQRGRNHSNLKGGAPSSYTNHGYSQQEADEDDVFVSPIPVSPSLEQRNLTSNNPRFSGNNLNKSRLSQNDLNSSKSHHSHGILSSSSLADRNNHSILSNNLTFSNRYPDRSWSKYNTTLRKDLPAMTSSSDHGYSGSRDHSQGDLVTSPRLPGSTDLDYNVTTINTSNIPPERSYLSDVIYHSHSDSKDSNPSHTPSGTPSQENSGQGSSQDSKPITWQDSSASPIGQEILGYPTDSKSLEKSLLSLRDFNRTSSTLDNTLTHSFVTNKELSKLDALSATRLLTQSKLESPVTNLYRRNTSSNNNLDNDFSRSESVFSTLDRVIPTHKQNGGVTHVKSLDKQTLSQSKRSLNLSKPSLNLSRLTLYGKDYGVQNSLLSLGLLSLLSLAVTILALQLLFALSAQQQTGAHSNHTLLTGTPYQNTMEVTIALTSFIAMVNLSCLVVTSMQCYFGAKLLKVPQGEERWVWWRFFSFQCQTSV